MYSLLKINKGDEAIEDTLLDMANYCLMTYMELQKENNGEVNGEVREK